MNIVFLGGGRITSAMVAGLRLAKTKHHLVVHDRNPGKLRQLKKAYAVLVEPDLKSAVRRAELLLITVRPDSVDGLLHAIARVDRPLLAVSLQRLGHARLAHCMRWIGVCQRALD